MLTALTSLLAAETRVTIATSPGLACSQAPDAGTTAPSAGGTTLTLSVATKSGDFEVGSSVRGDSVNAELSTWGNGDPTPTTEMAVSGTVSISLSQPGGGTIGDYDLVFASGEEEGHFVAPECDACLTSR